MDGWLWNYFQQRQIDEATRTANRANSQAGDLHARLNEAERRVELLTLTTLALAELLRERVGVTEAELEAKVRSLDLLDGQVNGRMQGPVNTRTFTGGVEAGKRPRRCVACGRSMSPQYERCLYCGGELVDGPVPPNK